MLIFMKGFFIGMCAIIPGVSGSVVAISLGIYQKFIESISSINQINKNKCFIILVLLGTLSGIILTGNFIIYIFKYKVLLYYSLIGIISSEIPFLIKKIHSHQGKKVKVVPLLLAFIFSLLINNIKNWEFLLNKRISYFFGGILFSFGKVFPGISSSFFLLTLGIYKDIIILVTKPLLLINDFFSYFPFILGTIIGLVIFYKLLIFLLKNKYESTYSMIIGFVLSSLIILIPVFECDFYHIMGILLTIIFFTLFIYIKKKNDS